MPAYAAQPHAVGGHFGDLGLGDVGHHVGREVGRRVVHLVEQLLLHGVGVDAPAGACGFGDGAVAVCVDLGDGVPQRGHAGHVFVAGVGVITTRHLGATFEQVARHGGAGDARPVVARPAKVGQRRAHRQRGVGHPAADHDVGTSQQGIGNGLCAQVGVGRHHVQPLQRRAQRLLQQRALVGALRPSPCTTAMRGAGRPSAAARAWIRRAAASGWAAPKLLTIRMPPCRQRASTGRSMSSSSGS